MSTTHLTDLAKAVLENVSKIEHHYNTHELPLPSFDEHSPADLSLPPELLQTRQKAVDAAIELQDLLIGPAMQVRPVLNATALQAIYKYDIPSKVPLDGEVSFQDLAAIIGVKQADVQRIIRFAIVFHRLFQEKKPGFVSHSAASRLLAEDPCAMAAVGFFYDEIYQGMGQTVGAIQLHGDPEPNQSGWAIASKSDVSMWEYHSRHPELGARATRAMEFFTKGFNHDTTGLTHGIDWSDVEVLVDLGGASGHVAIAMARAHPKLRCVVQDLPEFLAKAGYKVPEDVADRVTFQGHDFFNPQTVSAQVYLFRQVFHNWGDAHCIKMLRALIPALNPGAKVIVNDTIVPPPGVLPPMQERGVRAIDMIMMTLFNSREREKEQWEALFAEADSRFHPVRVWKPANSQLGMIEAIWSG